MTSTKEEIEVSYDVSNEFFRLWLDERMHYTCAVYENGHDTLEQAQVNKCRVLYDFAELTTTSGCSTSAAAGARTSSTSRAAA